MVVPQKIRPRLTIQHILAWADAYHRRTGKWPNMQTGPIDAAPGEIWSAVDGALRQGNRGLVGGSSLARLLAVKRKVRNRLTIPPLTIEQILAWADAHHARTGRWPTKRVGPVEGVPDETWDKLNVALKRGYRGLPSGSSLARLFAQERGVQTPGCPVLG